MSEEELRKAAVRRRLAGEGPEEIAAALGRSSRWVRKWVARHEEESRRDTWAQRRSRAPHSSPTRTPDALAAQILAARERLVANPRAQCGSLAVASADTFETRSASLRILGPLAVHLLGRYVDEHRAVSASPCCELPDLPLRRGEASLAGDPRPSGGQADAVAAP